MLAQGDSAPWFESRSSVRPTFHLDNLGGQYVVLSFIGSSTFGPSRQLVDDIERERGQFDICNACFFGVSIDADDEKLGRLQQKFPRVYYIWDSDASISRLYGAASADGKYFVHSLVLDPALRVLAVIPSDADSRAHVRRIIDVLKSVPPTTALDGFAPVLVLRHVFEEQLCRELIQRHEREGGQQVGLLGDVKGRSVRTYDQNVKRSRDWIIADPALLSALDNRLRRRVFPEIKKAFQFTATQSEGFVIACYDASEGAYFRPHRDNTNVGSAHRRFAVSIALDSDAYEGGGLCFPEYGSRAYRAPTGGAVVFSCSLMHEVRPVTRGKRYACPPFIFDDEGAKLRDANRRLAGGAPK